VRRAAPAPGEEVDQQRATAVELMQLLEGLVVEGQQLAGTHQQALALGGERDPPGRAGEQADAEPALQAADVAAERLLGHVQPCRGPGEMQLLGHRHERAQDPRVQLVRHPPTSHSDPD